MVDPDTAQIPLAIAENGRTAAGGMSSMYGAIHCSYSISYMVKKVKLYAEELE